MRLMHQLILCVQLGLDSVACVSRFTSQGKGGNIAQTDFGLGESLGKTSLFFSATAS